MKQTNLFQSAGLPEPFSFVVKSAEMPSSITPVKNEDSPVSLFPGETPQSILVCANSVRELRRCDVFRALEQAINWNEYETVLSLIRTERPDLDGVVNDCIEEFNKYQ